MCGIAGIAGIEKRDEMRTIAGRMTDALDHRGPDAQGIHVDGQVGLGHRRLAIIDLSEEANQPMPDASGRYVIVYNGEIYNFKEVRRQLSDYPFHTSSDTEVVLAAFAKWGEKCLSFFNGMFAFAIWDKKEGKLFIARDRLGIKPLYYVHQKGCFLFASEIRTLLASGLVDRKLSDVGLADYFSFQTVHPPHTIVEGIGQLRPGEWAILQNGTLRKHQYWRPAPAEDAVTSDYETAKKQVRQRLAAAVERRLVSDVPLGAFLSGGIDSSAVVALMAEVSARPVSTFSIVFNEERFDESEYSQLIARRYNTRHHAILLKPEDFLASLPEAIAAMDAPSGDAVNTYVVSKYTKKAGITVALSGLGGDELFMGYPLYHQCLRIKSNRMFWKTPRFLRKHLAAPMSFFLTSHQRAKLAEMAAAPRASIQNIYPVFRKILSAAEVTALGLGSPPPFDAASQLAGMNGDLAYSQLTIADLACYTGDVLLRDTDQMSMAHALEVRVPFFDHELVSYVLGLPDKWKYRPGYPKKLLVESLQPLIPEDIVFRKKKGFDLPWKVWMKNELRSFCEAKMERLRQRGILRMEVAQRLWSTFLAGKNDQLWSRIWVFVVLEKWLEENFD
ncbi:MAG: asparagine synthase (glutamine-hydrolyzing) [Saprospiraceae bacterium]